MLSFYFLSLYMFASQEIQYFLGRTFVIFPSRYDQLILLLVRSMLATKTQRRILSANSERSLSLPIFGELDSKQCL
jgi:hypothetical protein